jgi:uncharacterized protein YndB with AHSA1/START domain
LREYSATYGLHIEEARMDTIEREIVVGGTPEEAWRAVVESDWLGEDACVDPRPGGEVEGGGRRGFVEEADAPRRLTFWWRADDEDATRVEIDLEEQEDGTLVRVTESRPLALLDLYGADYVQAAPGPRQPELLVH